MGAAIADRIVALVWVVVGIVVFVAAGDISGGGANAQDALGPKFFPQAIGVILASLGLWLLFSDLLLRFLGLGRKNSVSGTDPLSDSTEGVAAPASMIEAPWWRVPLAVVITVAYVALLPVIHYAPATLIASIAMLYLLGARRLPVLIVYPIVLTFVAQYAFSEIVGVILP